MSIILYNEQIEKNRSIIKLIDKILLVLFILSFIGFVFSLLNKIVKIKILDNAVLLNASFIIPYIVTLGICVFLYILLKFVFMYDVMKRMSQLKNMFYAIHKSDEIKIERVYELRFVSELKLANWYKCIDEENRIYHLPKSDFAFKEINGNIGVLYDNLEVEDGEQVRVLEVFHGMFLVENEQGIKGMIPQDYIEFLI